MPLKPSNLPLRTGMVLLALAIGTGLLSGAPNIKVTKSVSSAPYAEGDTLIYSIIVENTTNQNLSTGFSVYDALPGGIAYISSTSPFYDPATHVWTITGPFNAHRIDTLHIVASVSAGAQGKTIVNTAYKNMIAGDLTSDDTSRVSIQITSLPPSITAALQPTGTRMQSMNVKLAGANFIQGVTQVNFGAGIVVTSRTVTAPDTLVAGIYIAAAAPLGPHDIRVTNPPPGGGTDSLAGGFSVENPIPVLTTLNPTFVYAGDTPTLTVNGSKFVPGSVVTVNGVNRAATYIDSTRIQATIPSSDVATSGYALIKVYNPPPGGGASANTDSLQIRPSADLAVQKLLGPLHNDTISYILKVKNLGPNDATNASLTDILPNTLVYISSAASGGGQYSAVSHVWTVGSVAAGDSATCVIVTRLANPNQSQVTITNIAGGVTATEHDRVTSNNADSVSIILKVLRPGDTNNDLVVDAKDIVEIGLCYGIVGPARTGTADTLQQYLPNGWNSVSSPEVCAYADCNGNGRVDSGDVGTIVYNWGRTHWTGGIEPSAGPPALSRAEIFRQLLASAQSLPPGGPRDELVAMLSSRLGEMGELPGEWRLEQNYPNPFNGGTTISYSVPRHEDAVRLRLFDVLGRVVRTFERSDVGQGTYAFQWDGNTEEGTQVASGVYFYRLEAAGFTAVRRLLFIR